MDMTNPLVIMGLFGLFSTWFILLFSVLRKYNEEQYQSSVRLNNAKAQFFESRAKNLGYQQRCTPTTDALDLIAEAIGKPTELQIELKSRSRSS